MLSLLAIVVTVLLLGSALLWHAVRNLPLAWARSVAIFRSLWRSGATLVERLFPTRAPLETSRNRRAGCR